MALDWGYPSPTLRTLLRPVPPLSPEDSLRRFLLISRQTGFSMLPVLRNGSLCGIISTSDLLAILALETLSEKESALDQPVQSKMKLPIAIANPRLDLTEAGALCAMHQLDILPVVDEEGFCLGLLSAGDLLLPDPTSPRPPLIGGMATPFGVYLTDGVRQAGANNLALVSTGVFMALLHMLSYLIIGAGLRLAQSLPFLKSMPTFRLDYDPPAQQPWLGLLSVVAGLLTTALFLFLIRSSRLAGYHAAEHQTVHALEHGERLLPEIVRRMPRPHPRCGTNFLAAGLIFINLVSALHYMPFIDTSSATLLAAVTTLFTWRQFGNFLQERFTTRPANERQIASGISAANELLQQYWQSPPERVTWMRRVWCMGILQVLAGMAPTLVVLLSLLEHWKL